MIDAFGVELGEVGKAATAVGKAAGGMPHREVTPSPKFPPGAESMRVLSGQSNRVKRKFAARFAPGTHDVALGHLRRLPGSERNFSHAEHQARVEAIMPSMRKHGLRHPVEVQRYTPTGGGALHADFASGGHRLEAARRLGWKTIPTVVHDVKNVVKRRA